MRKVVPIQALYEQSDAINDQNKKNRISMDEVDEKVSKLRRMWCHSKERSYLVPIRDYYEENGAILRIL